MPSQRLNLDILAELRRLPVFYALLRGVKRLLVDFPIKTLLGIFRLLPSSFPFTPPRGTYSLLEQLQKGEVKGEVKSSGEEVPPHEFPFCLRSKMFDAIFAKYPCFWANIQKAHLVGKGLTPINNRKQICIEAAYSGQQHKYDLAFSSLVSPTPTLLRGNWTSIVSHYNPIDQPTNYAHYLMESLPRLRWMSDFPEDTRIIAPAIMKKYHTEPLEIMGLADRVRNTSEQNLEVENCYFTPPSSMILGYNPSAVEWLRRTFLHHGITPEIAREKIYIPRYGQTRMASNEDEVVEFFRNAGWLIIDTATLNFKEQIGLFKNARAICGMHGAAFSNMSWASKGCHAIEIFPSNFISGCHEWLAFVNGVHYHPLEFPYDRKLNAVIDLKILKEKLRELQLMN